MTKALQPGEFIGEQLRVVRAADAILTLVSHPKASTLEPHTHSLAYFCTLLDGAYSEHYSGRSIVYHPFSLALHPAGYQHWDEIGSDGAIFFMIELDRPWNERLREHVDLDTVKVELRGNDLVWSAMRVFQEFSEYTPDSELHLESLLFELIASAARLPENHDAGSPWFQKVVSFLDERFCEPLSMREIAGEAGVHPITLARAFRTHQQQTASEYINRLRVRLACNLILRGRSLAEVSGECGFADQSYFSRVFKNVTGTTPGAFGKRLIDTIESP